MRRAIILILVAATAVGIVVFPIRNVGAANGPMVGKEAPDFTLSDLSGNQVKLSDLKGKIVFVNLFATWCPACRQEMPDINTFYNDSKSQDVVVLAIDLQEVPSAIRDFMAQNKYTFPVLLDSDGKVSDLYHIDGIPAWFFIDKNGLIKASKVGPTSTAEMIMRALSMQ